MKNDEECLLQIRNIVTKIGDNEKAGFNRTISKPPLFPTKEIYGILPEDPSKQYDMNEVIARIIDNSELDEYKAGLWKNN